MKISTCFCATTGKVSYLAIKVSLLMPFQVTSEEPLAQSGNRHGSIFDFSHRCHEQPHPAPNAFMAQLKFSSRM
jgi:hypothetical protein